MSDGALYTCYLGLDDPLVRTQVVAYLAGLAERGHRAIGVVYDPEAERYGNYVPTVLPLRYAAFHSKAGDTQASIKPRMVAYYAQVLADRARPPAPRPGWGRRPGAPAAAAPAPEAVAPAKEA